jgi:hypothetical protein
MGAGQGVVQEIVVGAPVAATALAALKGGGNYQIRDNKHIHRFLPGGIRRNAGRERGMMLEETRAQAAEAGKRFEQACLVAAERDILPHDLSQFATHLDN